MNSEVYQILAMIVRYALIALVFLVIIQAIKESRKDNIYRDFAETATLNIVDQRIVYALEQDNIIGRANKCDVIIKDRTVKRTHARLYMESDEWIIEPYRRARVYVNLQEVEDTYVVEDDDEIIFGDMVCIFCANYPELEEGYEDEED